jgi:hypothetical protein
MERYRNLTGTSAVTAYEIGLDYIIVRFKGGDNYTYDYGSAGREAVETMKALAIAGKGLNSYIGTHVRKRYSSKS